MTQETVIPRFATMKHRGFAVRFVRLLIGVSASELALRIGCKNETLSRFEHERGKRKKAGRLTVELAAEKLGVEVELIEQAERFCQISRDARELDHQQRLSPQLADEFIAFKTKEGGWENRLAVAHIEALRQNALSRRFAHVWHEYDFALAAEIIASIRKQDLRAVYQVLNIDEKRVRTTYRRYDTGIQLYACVANILGVTGDALKHVASYCGQQHIQFLRRRAKLASTTIMEHVPGVVEKVEALLEAAPSELRVA